MREEEEEEKEKDKRAKKNAHHTPLLIYSLASSSYFL
jgi:hypothetical protein